MIRILIFLALVFSAYAADIVPAGRRIDWTPGVTVGYRGGLPTGRTMWTNIVAAGADNTGVGDNTALMTSLFNTCPSNKFIYAPAGIYKLSTGITWNGNTNGFALIGDGTNTIFRPTVEMFHTDNANYGAPFRIFGSPAKGDTNLTTTGTDMSGHVGKLVIISGNNDGRSDLRIIGITHRDRLLQQVVMVETVSNQTNFTVSPPLVWNFPSTCDPWAKLNSTSCGYIGFENFTVEGGSQQQFYVFGSHNFYWFQVKAILGASYFLNSGYSQRFTIQNCYFYSTNAGAGSSVVTTTTDSSHLFENSYSKGGSPMYMLNQTVGCVVAYNYATNSISNDQYVGNPYDHHEPHSMMNLWEGNYGEMFQHDAYFGSASHMTLYRNWFHTMDPDRSTMPRAVDLGRWTSYANVVGNVLGGTTRTFHYSLTNRFYNAALATCYRFGFPHPGNNTYQAGQITPFMDWRYPGHQNRVGFVTNTATVATNRIAGTFTNVTAGAVIAIQTAANTNIYYPHETNFISWTVTDVQPAYIELNQSTVSTNNDTVYLIGDGAFYEMLDYDSVSTHLLHGNYDYSNNVVTWDTLGFTSDSNMPPSLYLTSAPAFATNRSGAAMNWPIVNPTNATIADWYARSLWEDPASRPNAGQKIRGIKLRVK